MPSGLKTGIEYDKYEKDYLEQKRRAKKVLSTINELTKKTTMVSRAMPYAFHVTTKTGGDIRERAETQLMEWDKKHLRLYFEDEKRNR